MLKHVILFKVSLLPFACAKSRETWEVSYLVVASMVVAPVPSRRRTKCNRNDMLRRQEPRLHPAGSRPYFCSFPGSLEALKVCKVSFSCNVPNYTRFSATLHCIVLDWFIRYPVFFYRSISFFSTHRIRTHWIIALHDNLTEQLEIIIQEMEPSIT